MIKNNIEFENGDFGVKAILKGSWEEGLLGLLLEKNVKELELNDGKGWFGGNVDFLSSFTGLKALTIIDLRIASLEPIHYLTKIEKLNISTYSKNPIRFDVFKNLTECRLEWIKGSDTLFGCSKMKKLYLNNYDGSDSFKFSSFKDLEELSIMNSNLFNIKGLSGLVKLKRLTLARLRNLESLDGIEQLSNLEELEIEECKHIHSVIQIFNLFNLTKLALLNLGNIETLKGLENLVKLKLLVFYESTNIIDGDLTPIKRLPNLERVSFQNRKHYTHKREEFI